MSTTKPFPFVPCCVNVYIINKRIFFSSLVPGGSSDWSSSKHITTEMSHSFTAKNVSIYCIKRQHQHLLFIRMVFTDRRAPPFLGAGSDDPVGVNTRRPTDWRADCCPSPCAAKALDLCDDD